MKQSIRSLTTVFWLVSALAASPVLAGPGHGPKFGGVAREVKNVTYELVAKPDSLTLHISNHDKVISTQNATAEAVIYAGNEKTRVVLEPAGDNRMLAKGNFRVGVGVRVAMSVSLAGKPADKVTFNLK